MKAHIRVDSKTKLIHSVVARAANVHDSQALPHRLHGKERRVWDDSAYRGQRAVIRKHASQARDFTQEKAGRNQLLTEEQRRRNRTKSSTRSRVEHCFFIIVSLALLSSATADCRRICIDCGDVCVGNLFSALNHLP